MEYRARISGKGQVTIPAKARRALGLRGGDHVSLVLVGEELRLRRAESLVARTPGGLSGDRPPLTAEALRDTAEQAIAGEAVEQWQASGASDDPGLSGIEGD